MINSKAQLLLGYCDGIYQFPGGHVEEGEELNSTVKREIKEETGIELNVNNILPFYCIKHYKKNYNETGMNRLSQLYYFLIKTDKQIDMNNIRYTEHEKSGGYRLEYISLDQIEETLKNNIPNNVHNPTIVKEMLAAIEASGIIGEKNNKDNHISHLGTKEINTSRLLLRRFKESDLNELYEGYMNQEEYLYYANKERKAIEEINEKLKKIMEKYSNNNYYNWVIILKETTKIIGSINLHVNVNNDSVEFNYAIDNRYINNGYMTEALNAIKEFSLNELNVNRFQGGCCVENLPSKRVMEKCQMEFEGKLRSYIKLKDGYHDMYMFSIIKK